MVSLINDILLFTKIAEFNTLKEGALHVGLSPSTLGRKISKLEEALNERLLIASSKGFILTPLGQKIYHQFYSYNYRMEKDFIDYLNDKEGYEITINILIPFVAFDSLPADSIAQINNKYPGINLNFSIYNGFGIQTDHQSEFDLIISYLFPTNQYFTAQKIFETKTKLYCSQEYVKNYGIPKTIEELKTHRKRITSLTDNLNVTDNATGVIHKITSHPALANLVVNPINYLNSGRFIIESAQGKRIIAEGNLEVLPNYSVNKYTAYILKNQIRYIPLLDKIENELIKIINNIISQFNVEHKVTDKIL